MLKLNEYRETRAAKIAEMQAIISTAERENRELSDNESQRFDALRSDAEKLDQKIERQMSLADMERRAEADPVGGHDMQREVRGRYSVAKALQECAAGRLTGLEAETHAELAKGREVRGVMVPAEILLGVEHRNQNVGTATAGGNLVATNLQPIADRFRPALKIEQMGATVLRGLSGFVDLPNVAGSGSVTWVAEGGNATRSAMTFSKVAMGPKTVTGEYMLSRRLMLQSSTAIENLLRSDLGFLLAQAMDLAAIKGGGTNQPTGILAAAGIEEVTPSTALSDTVADLIAALDLDDVTGTRAILTNPKVMRLVRKTKDGDGHIIPAAEQFHNERVEVTNQVPSDLGTAPSNNKSGLIYGQWSELVLGYWSGVDILVNPYHPDVASNGGALVHAFLDCDVAIRNAKAFAFAKVTT